MKLIGQKVPKADLLAAGYKVVYKSGHGTVWCNGEMHKSTQGGYAACYDQDPEFPVLSGGDDYKCNCARFKITNPFG